ncbi:MAG: aldo/keto reductase [Planctomycetota bacterium]|nr:aldo/keto reductase [Planctomycetota bacterium]
MRTSALPGLALKPSVVALGTGPYGSAIDRDASFAMLDAYAEAGGNFLDSAHVYASWVAGGEGASEKTIGAWMKARQNRARIVVGTKGAHPDLKTMHIPRMRPEDIAKDLGESLERLETDYIDLYWLHRDDLNTPVGEILGALNEHLAAGRIRALGASNWTVARLQEAADYAAREKVTGFCASQIGWSLARVNPGISGQNGTLYMDDPTMAYHRSSKLPVAAYSSQGNGFFGGKYRRGEAPEGKKAGMAKKYFSDANFGKLERAQQLGQELGRSANEVAVAYITSQPFAGFAIVGPNTMDQLHASCAAGSLELTPSQVAWLEGPA